MTRTIRQVATMAPTGRRAATAPTVPSTSGGLAGATRARAPRCAAQVSRPAFARAHASSPLPEHGLRPRPSQTLRDGAGAEADADLVVRQRLARLALDQVDERALGRRTQDEA